MREIEKNKRICNEKGQSTLEFALTLILLLSFVLFYFQLSMFLAFGNYVHYATFMAARAYLSASDDRGDQVNRAKSIIVSMLKRSVGESGIDKFPSIAKGSGQGDPLGFQVDDSLFNPTDPAYNWLQGIRYTFTGKVFLVPLAGLSAQAASSSSSPSVNTLTLTSESWLGREPAYDECQGAMNESIFDNGC